MTRLLGLKKIYTSAYHPQGNGICEAANGNLLSRCQTMETIQNHKEALAWASFAYRVSVHSKLKDTPFHALLGLEPRMPHDSLPPKKLYRCNAERIAVLAELRRERQEELEGIISKRELPPVRFKRGDVRKESLLFLYLWK
eukprot:GHVO01045537.1.p1 GENE.GHVO01045537.1~~GHVO01045537.1.p1  ORF type:complete len:141 (-),score=10.39 GHVO01045537.1:156-578(-)